MMKALKKVNWKKLGIFAGGVLFGTAGIKVLSSKDAKNVYTHCTAGVLRAKDCVMKTANTIQENCGDIYAGAKDINEARAQKAAEADGFVFGSPVYYAHPSGRILSFLDRAFYSGKKAFEYKPGASVAVARRGGTSASFDVMNKYFGISQMPVAGSTYWNLVHGRVPGEAELDAEGMQTMRNLAKNLAWMLKCFEAGKAAGVALPDTERGNQTNFIR